MEQNPKIVFFGTPHFATFVLDELEKAGILPARIVTTPDKPAGRGLFPKPPPVKEWAVGKSIPVFQPENLKTESANLESENADLFIVAAYGKILPPELLALPRRGVLNVHPSLLPKFRGPSPIESAILANDKETGVSIILLDEKPDHGPVVAYARAAPAEWPARRSALENLLWHAGGTLLAETIPEWLNGSLAAQPQDDSQATFTKKIEKEDGRIDLSGGAYANYLTFCAYEGWPGTFFFAKKNGKEIRVNIADAKYENNAFIPTRVIPEGKKEMDYSDFLRSAS